MVRERFAAAISRLHNAIAGSRKAVVGIAGLLLIEVGGRIGLPGLNTQVLSDFLLHRGGGVLSIYNWFVGGALARGAVLALGIMPYLSARLYVWLARSAFPTVANLEADEAGRMKLRVATRFLTAGLALVQSYGVAKFAQAIPGAVAQPGAGFIIQTMLTLTAGAIVATVLAEQVSMDLAATEDDEPVSDTTTEARVEAVGAGEAVSLLQAAPLDPVIEVPRAREAVNAPR
jgi:preprotein translocase subunit SecY